MSKSKKVLVFGATGQQGGAVTNALLEAGHQVIGLTRDTSSAKSKALSEKGVDMRQGNFHSSHELIDIMKEVDTVFAVTTPFEEGVEKEAEQGIAMADAAKEAGVQHFIFNSVANADQNTGIPHFESKYKVEEHLISIGIPYTILAPVYFMDNLVAPWAAEDLKQGNINMGMPADRDLQQIAVQDIAGFVAAVTSRREDFIGQRIDLASDELTGDQMARTLTGVTGKQFTFNGFDPDLLRASMGEDMALMYEWFISVGYSASLDTLRKQFPEVELTSFSSFAKQQDWGFLG